MQPSHRRLLNDTYSRHFVRDPVLRACLIHPLMSRAFIAVANRLCVGLHTYIVLRARYIDDVLKSAVRAGIDQLVLLGAGFDTTSLRTATPVPVKIFEVDAPATQQNKRLIFDRLRANLNNDIVWVPCHFEHDTLRQRLLTNGFDPTRRSLVVLAGVTTYLTRSAIEATLTDLATICAPGSDLVLDYVDTDVITGRTRFAGARRAAGLAARRGEPFRTGFTPIDIDNLLDTHGFRRHEQVGLPELLQRYAPTHARRPIGGDWQTITTATRS
ncbi:MAG: SAM-dependent methyltransferase [Mycobacterium sp.]|nr:SAM-dependent methyltransferase [Mycobacterium sp.]